MLTNIGLGLRGCNG